MKRNPDAKKWASEAELCAAFIKWHEARGFKAYAETAGFDILLVAPDGTQYGVQAKLRFNIKVLSQLLPPIYDWVETGPDFRVILTPEGGNCSICEALGFIRCAPVMKFNYRHWVDGSPHEVQFTSLDCNGYGRNYDWNPATRCHVPEFQTDSIAGSPAPIQLTQWKVGALKVLAHLEVHGSITRKEITQYGNDSRRWCQLWLKPAEAGRFSKGPAPAFNAQHPAAYAEILASMRTAA